MLVERNPTGISLLESLMYTWIAAFAYDELGGITDAGMLFYQMGFWSIWNLAIIGTGVAFVITRESSSFESPPCKFSSPCTISLTVPVFHDVIRQASGDALMWDHLGTVGLVKGSEYITDLSFDILSIEAVFLVPRQA